MTKKQLFIMIVLALIVFTNVLESMILMPLSSTIKASLDMNEKQWGIVISSYLFAAFVSGILAINIIDKFDRKKLLLSQYALFLVGTLLCGLATSYEFLVFARICAGFFGGMSSALVLAITGDLIAPQHRGKATGIVMTGFSVAAAFGIPLGISIGINLGWNYPFYFLVGFSSLVFVLAFTVVPSMTAHIKEKSIGFIAILKSIMSQKNQLLALAFSCLLLFGQFAIIPYLADYVEQNIGFRKDQLFWMYGIGGLLTLFTGPLVGYLTDKFGQRKIFLIMMLLSCVPIYFVTSLGATPISVVLVATSCFFIFAGGRNIPGTSIVISTAAPHERGAFMSIRSALQQLFSGIAVMLSSLVVYQDDTGKYFNFHLIGYLAIFTSILSYFLFIRIKAKA